jgi:penicillin-insensitive murein DD-endopeptidase
MNKIELGNCYLKPSFKLFIFVIFGFNAVLAPAVASNKLSQCYGTTSNGKLKNGVKLPSSGENFEQYSSIAAILGRTYVHSSVRDIIIDAYQLLHVSHPDKVYKYAETGKEKGGQFKPHRTHRNGLSVDFMTPVMDKYGKSVHLPTHSLNRFGYDIEFDTDNRYDNLVIDFEALAAHLVALHKSAKKRGFDLWRVIFDPKLQPLLLKTADGQYIKEHITLSKRRAWVRHDEHYHVDFSIPCLPLK